MAQVRQRARPPRPRQQRVPGITRITSKNQATIPVAALRTAGLKAGDQVVITAVESGKVTIARAENPLLKHAGSLTGVYPKGYLRTLRAEWRS